MGTRLTERTGNAVVYVGRHTKMPGIDGPGSLTVAARRDVMNLLAEYEDTGWTPEEVTAAKQLIDGTLARLVECMVAMAPQLVHTVRDAMQRMTPEQIVELLRCWHGITRPGYEPRQTQEPGDLTEEERYQMQKIVTTLQEASETAKDGGLLGDAMDGNWTPYPDTEG